MITSEGSYFRNYPLQPLVWTIQPQQQVARLGSNNPFQPTSPLAQQSAVPSNLGQHSAIPSYHEEKSAVSGPILAFKSPVSSLEPQSPFSRLGIQSPVAYIDPRALCSYCRWAFIEIFIINSLMQRRSEITTLLLAVIREKMPVADIKQN